MTKNELIGILKSLQGNPIVYIKLNGETYPIGDDVEIALCENSNGHIFTFSATRKDELATMDECIILWADTDNAE